jgi:hypothetical protein
MAHTICGIDVGTFSVKFAFFEVGFRTHTLRGLMETAIGAGEAPMLQRQMDAVREGLAQVSGEVTPYLAVPGDQLSLRVLELPFSDSRKIDQVVGYELEGQIVHSIEDVVFDHLVVGHRRLSSSKWSVRPAAQNRAMPEISRFFGIRILMYAAVADRPARQLVGEPVGGWRASGELTPSISPQRTPRCQHRLPMLRSRSPTGRQPSQPPGRMTHAPFRS